MFQCFHHRSCISHAHMTICLMVSFVILCNRNINRRDVYSPVFFVLLFSSTDLSCLMRSLFIREEVSQKKSSSLPLSFSLLLLTIQTKRLQALTIIRVSVMHSEGRSIGKQDEDNGIYLFNFTFFSFLEQL